MFKVINYVNERWYGQIANEENRKETVQKKNERIHIHIFNAVSDVPRFSMIWKKTSFLQEIENSHAAGSLMNVA